MGIFDKAKDAFETQKDKLDPNKISQGIEKAGDFIDAKTGGKYADKVDKAQAFADDKARDLLRDDDPAAPTGAPTEVHTDGRTDSQVPTPPPVDQPPTTPTNSASPAGPASQTPPVPPVQP